MENYRDLFKPTFSLAFVQRITAQCKSFLEHPVNERFTGYGIY